MFKIESVLLAEVDRNYLVMEKKIVTCVLILVGYNLDNL